MNALPALVKTTLLVWMQSTPSRALVYLVILELSAKPTSMNALPILVVTAGFVLTP
jgi:hypothetical protein